MLKVKLVTIGRFWHFHLARQLLKYNLLDEIYSGYPKFKLVDEKNIPSKKIKTYPYYQVPYLFYNRYFQNTLPFINHYLSDLSHKKIAIKVSKNIGNSNVLIGTSGSGLEAGKKIKSLNGKFVCDRGSTHINFQNETIKNEYKNFNLDYNEISQKTVERELEEYDTADLISVPSSFVYNSFLKNGIEEKKLFLNPFGVNLDRFSPLPKINDGKFQVLYVGTLSIRKGIFYLLEAFKKLNFKNKKLTLIGPIEKNIKDKVFKNLSDKIEYLSVIKNKDLNRYYSMADVMVQPSIEEGLSLVMAEALACGCPVIATENTGASDLFQNNKEGFIIKAKSIEQIHDKMQLLADNKILQKEMSNNAVLNVEKIGGWNHYGDNWQKKLKNIIND